jgi:hypothetical protein
VELIGGDNYMSGNVFAKNPSTGTYGPVCDTYWSMKEVSTQFALCFALLYIKLSNEKVSFKASKKSSKICLKC